MDPQVLSSVSTNQRKGALGVRGHSLVVDSARKTDFLGSVVALAKGLWRTGPSTNNRGNGSGVS